MLLCCIMRFVNQILVICSPVVERCLTFLCLYICWFFMFNVCRWCTWRYFYIIGVLFTIIFKYFIKFFLLFCFLSNLMFLVLQFVIILNYYFFIYNFIFALNYILDLESFITLYVWFGKNFYRNVNI